MMRNKNQVTAAELISSLNKDKSYQSKMKAKRKALATRWKDLKIDELSVVAELNDAGYKVDSVWDLANTKESYLTAIPLLMKHLVKKHQAKTHEGIVRALTTPEAKGYAPQLISKYISISDEGSQLKWLLGRAIAHSATDSDVDNIIDLIRNEKNGSSREFLPIGLAAEISTRVEQVLSSISDDPCMGSSAKKVLSNMKNGNVKGDNYM